MGRRRLFADSVTRFRAADGFSHSRALAFQLTLTLLPALIAVVGLAAALDQEELRLWCGTRCRRSRRAPQGKSSQTRCGRARPALDASPARPRWSAGALAAAVAGTTAMAQVERGANRIYGVERDRPFGHKYVRALLLAMSAGLLALLSLALLMGGAAIRDAVDWSEGLDAVWRVARWPLGVAFAVASVSLLFEYSPRRRQPEASWLAFGAAVSVGLWLVFMALLAVYIDTTDSFGATYGPLAGTIGVLLWAFLASVGLFLGLAFAAQLEAVRAGVPAPRREQKDDD